MKSALSTNAHRLLEEAADALARLDVACRFAPRSFAEALALATISDLANAGPKGTRSLIATFDGISVVSLDPAIAHWRDLAQAEERRARGGAPLTIASLRRSGLSVPEAVAGPLRILAGDQRPAVLLRTLDLAALVPDRSLGELAAALVLCAEGRTDRMRMLPFGGVPRDERAEAVARWRDGDTEPWSVAATQALAEGAWAIRGAVERAMSQAEREDAQLARIGRAAVTARPALEELRSSLACTVPSLADDLGVSRPAASDALERLCALGLAAEVTGRKRDRVFAYVAALELADVSLRNAGVA